MATDSEKTQPDNEEQGGKDRRDYHKDYYREHRDEIAERKKSRYQEDEAYRQERIEAQRAYRERKRKELEKKLKGKQPERKRGGPRKPKMVRVNGGEEEAFTFGVLAEKVGRSKVTLNYWSRNGIFPETPFRTERGERLYTMPMIDSLADTLSSYGRMSSGDTSFKDEVEEAWRELGVPC